LVVGQATPWRVEGPAVAVAWRAGLETRALPTVWAAARALPCLGFPARLLLLWPVVLAGEALLPAVPVPLVEVLVQPVEVLVPPVVPVGEVLH